MDGHDLDGLADPAKLGDAWARTGEARSSRALAAREDLAALGEGGDPRRLVDAAALDVLAELAHSGGVHADSDLRRESLRLPVLRELPLYRDRGGQRSVGCLEGDEEAVSRRAQLLACVTGEDRP